MSGATRGWRQRLYVIIFEADTPAGKGFDLALIAAIVASVIVVMLESVTSIREQYGHELYVAEWGFTILFTIEYIARLSCTRRPLRYARSFFGIVDLLAILPTYLAESDGSLRRTGEPIAALETELWLLVHPDLRKTARVRAVLDYLAGHIRLN